jgi:phosphohistidine phosphatase SixA
MSTSKAAPRKSTRKSPPPPPPPQPERFLVLLRHGIAEDPTPDKKDEDRALTAEGHARMKEIARGLARVLPKAQAIYSSPLLRAVQTSLWVSKGYQSRLTVTTTEALVPGASTKDFLALIASIKERRAVIVGHEPTLTNDLRALVELNEWDRVELKKGGCYGVRILGDGTAVWEWMLTPRVLRKLGD